MSTPLTESAFYAAVQTAEMTRQGAKAAAFTTYGFVQANYAAYQTALIAADVAYANSISSAASAAGIDPQLAMGGPIAHAAWGKIGGH